MERMGQTIVNSEFYVITDNGSYLYPEWDGYNFAFIWYPKVEWAEQFYSYEAAQSFIAKNKADLSPTIKIQKCKATYVLEDC